ncbi:hypothetical protein ASPZODRAFT_126607 [Penicilliopsis zonata CBS 506.65]|uniref:Cyanovirin-N domain-containing protein n=1 Tax=Penicilliopsis zonata CBS 506.65 TaxID=1073090 RepID=A0A1L9SU02_9EURO|nr:hypothetical protein ASPZODRAFT_126607 [Penicilliopsis zonata CBS 506.65]OJJ50682.1 hypothetical protein ASPZODRAFT_126607 [Penicilliopsis zonata CBS 506.65]
MFKIYSLLLLSLSLPCLAIPTTNIKRNACTVGDSSVSCSETYSPYQISITIQPSHAATLSVSDETNGNTLCHADGDVKQGVACNFNDNGVDGHVRIYLDASDDVHLMVKDTKSYRGDDYNYVIYSGL